MSWKYFLYDACLYNLPTGENQYGRGGPRPNGPRVPEPLGFGGGCGSTGGAPQCVPHSVRCELSCWSKNCYLGGQSVSKPQTGQQIFLCIHFILLVCVYCFYCMSTKHFCIENSQLCHSTVIALEYPLCSKQINIIASRMVQMLWSAAEHKLSPRHAWHWRSETRGRTDVKTNSVFSLVRVREKKHGRLLAHLRPRSVTPCPCSLKTYLAAASTAPIIPSRVAHNKHVRERGVQKWPASKVEAIVFVYRYHICINALATWM